MSRLIREQRIERRIARQQRDLYATTSRYDIDKYAPSVAIARPIQRTPLTLTIPRVVVRRPIRTMRRDGLLHTVSVFLETLITKLTNADLCYVVAFLISTALLSVTLNANSAIVNHTLQPPTFSLPQLEDNQLPVYVSRQPVKAPDGQGGTEEYRALRADDYVVQSGQTLSELAEIHNVTMSTLVSFNSISNARGLQAGTTYAVPDREGILYTVRNGENIEQIAERNGVSVNTLLDVNNLQSAFLESNQELFIPGATLSDFDLRLSLGELFARPIYGRRTSGFGYRRDPFTGVRRFHYGLDLAAPTGTPILASMEGQISYIGDQSRGYGKYVIVRHPGGFQSLYAHMNGFNVRTGQYISRGQTIGWVGNTGRSTGPHLHFSIIKNGKFVHPEHYLY